MRGAAVDAVECETTSNRLPKEIHVNELCLYTAAAEAMGLEPVRLAIYDSDADGGKCQPIQQDDVSRDAFRECLEARAEGIGTGRLERPKERRSCAGDVLFGSSVGRQWGWRRGVESTMDCGIALFARASPIPPFSVECREPGCHIHSVPCSRRSVHLEKEPAMKMTVVLAREPV